MHKPLKVIVALLLFAFGVGHAFATMPGHGPGVRQMQEAEPPFRPPAVPLIVTDPYMSMWSRTDHAYDSFSTHWAGEGWACSPW